MDARLVESADGINIDVSVVRRESEDRVKCGIIAAATLEPDVTVDAD